MVLVWFFFSKLLAGSDRFLWRNHTRCQGLTYKLGELETKYRFCCNHIVGETLILKMLRLCALIILCRILPSIACFILNIVKQVRKIVGKISLIHLAKTDREFDLNSNHHLKFLNANYPQGWGKKKPQLIYFPNTATKESFTGINVTLCSFLQWGLSAWSCRSDSQAHQEDVSLLHATNSTTA